MNQYRQHLQHFYQAALAAVNGREQVKQYLHTHPLHTTCAVLAVGKAAIEMTQGVIDVVGDQLHSACVIGKAGLSQDFFADESRINYYAAGHPIPDQHSLHAGQALLNYLQSLPSEIPLLVLTSGGASALVEVLPPYLSLHELQKTNQWLLGSGLDIHAMNAVRKQVSAIKAGRLSQYVQGREVINLIISDVPGDDLRAIGSGLLIPHEPLQLPKNLPDWLENYCTYALPLAPVAAFAQIKPYLLTTAYTARQAAYQAAKQAGYSVTCFDDILTGDAIKQGKYCVEFLRYASKGVYIWSSETTVNLPESVGQGGRCQTLCTSAAKALCPDDTIYLLAAGTDGDDGNNHVAGAVIDNQSCIRAQQHGFDAYDALRHANTGQFLHASGDVIKVGATGTNVMDIIIGLKA